VALGVGIDNFELGIARNMSQARVHLGFAKSGRVVSWKNINGGKLILADPEQVSRPRVEDAEISSFLLGCRKLLELYPDRPQKIAADSEVILLAKRLAAEWESIAKKERPTGLWKGDSSCGLGNWAVTPWLGLYDTRETEKASSGVYPVIHFLFTQDDGCSHMPSSSRPRK